MVEVEEIELDLALSIGGTFGRPTVEKPAPDSTREARVAVEAQREKREIQALRRMEARRKREQRRERVREPETEFERAFKREKTNAVNAWETPFRVHQFATVQYLPLHNNGFPLPCWVGTSENNLGAVDAVNGADGKTKTKSNASSRCSSSAVSDYQSSSREDGGSTDSHSHSVHSLAEPSYLNTSKEIISTGTQQQLEESASASSHPTGPKQDLSIQERPHMEKTTSNNNTLPIENPNPNPNPSTNPNHEPKFDMGKPPKPLSHTSSSLPQMPYVSTKGLNGKTVNGFLYRYTKSEVSIVCVCHGSTFSPAEFVQHAGGTDISHPLRHITVIPSSFR